MTIVLQDKQSYHIVISTGKQNVAKCNYTVKIKKNVLAVWPSPSLYCTWVMVTCMRTFGSTSFQTAELDVYLPEICWATVFRKHSNLFVCVCFDSS